MKAIKTEKQRLEYLNQYRSLSKALDLLTIRVNKIAKEIEKYETKMFPIKKMSVKKAKKLLGLK